MESMIYIGRFEQTADGKMRCSWSGSAVEAGFEGTCAKASLKSTAEEDYVDVVIDGKHRRKLVLRQDIQEYVLVQGLPYGSHRVRVIKRTEGSKSILTIGGFWYPDGKPAAVCPVRSRKIELIGDSITAGFGNEGPADWSGFQMATENACCTYGALTAEALDADAVIIAWSGMGLVQDLAGNRAPVMPELYCRTLATEPESVWDFFRSVPILSSSICEPMISMRQSRLMMMNLPQRILHFYRRCAADIPLRHFFVLRERLVIRPGAQSKEPRSN